ncbi:MAG: bacteriohemerythrin [Desulforhopalus sp.]
MSKIAWDDLISIYDEELDNQHRGLIDLYNNLYDSIVSDSVQEMNAAKLEALNQLLEYTANHFLLEEKFMESNNYPQLIHHRQLHRELTNKIRALHQDIRDEKMVLTTSLMKLLREWIVHHIGHEDKKIALFNQKAN